MKKIIRKPLFVYKANKAAKSSTDPTAETTGGTATLTTGTSKVLK